MENLEKAAEMFEREALLPEDRRIQCVSIVTPNDSHAAITCAALAAGTGRVRGVDGKVDRNVFAGSKNDFDRWLAGEITHRDFHRI